MATEQTLVVDAAAENGNGKANSSSSIHGSQGQTGSKPSALIP